MKPYLFFFMVLFASVFIACKKTPVSPKNTGTNEPNNLTYASKLSRTWFMDGSGNNFNSPRSDGGDLFRSLSFFALNDTVVIDVTYPAYAYWVDTLRYTGKDTVTHTVRFFGDSVFDQSYTWGSMELIYYYLNDSIVANYRISARYGGEDGKIHTGSRRYDPFLQSYLSAIQGVWPLSGTLYDTLVTGQGTVYGDTLISDNITISIVDDSTLRFDKVYLGSVPSGFDTLHFKTIDYSGHKIIFQSYHDFAGGEAATLTYDYIGNKVILEQSTNGLDVDLYLLGRYLKLQ